MIAALCIFRAAQPSMLNNRIGFHDVTLPNAGARSDSLPRQRPIPAPSTQVSWAPV